MNLVEKAQKVIGFKLQITNACRKQGIAAPTDKQISEYINDYGMDIKDFMLDYTEHEGMFRSPIKDFADKVWEYAWSEKNKPTMEEMTAWTEKNGYNVEDFLHQRTIASYDPLERATLLKTLELLDDAKLVVLWNKFIEESVLYGDDSHIFDLNNEVDYSFLRHYMTKADFTEVTRLKVVENVCFIQWYYHNDNSIKVKKDIKGIIIAYWGEIFERIMMYPTCYLDMEYFSDVFFPCVREICGYKIKDNNLVKK